MKHYLPFNFSFGIFGNKKRKNAKLEPTE